MEDSKIDTTGYIITVNVPFGADLNIAPLELTLSPETDVTPSGSEVRDFENPVTYLVTAENEDVHE